MESRITSGNISILADPAYITRDGFTILTPKINKRNNRSIEGFSVLLETNPGLAYILETDIREGLYINELLALRSVLFHNDMYLSEMGILKYPEKDHLTFYGDLWRGSKDKSRILKRE